MRTFGTLALATMALVGCGPSEGGGGPPEKPARTCVPPPGTTGSPKTIEEAMALINALPKPTSLSCYLESLDRPLNAFAANSVFSAQPAQGPRSPRLFIFSGSLITSIVPDGPGAPLLEFGQLGPDLRSLKAEIVFPVEKPLAPEVPYARIMFNPEATSCSFCHAEEQPAVTVGSARGFTSRALRPSNADRVPLEDVRGEADRCDASTEPARCEILRALFSFGDVRTQAFPANMPTLSGN